MRTYIALGICVVSAALFGYFCLFHHYSPTLTTLNIWVIWSFTADWLGRRLWLLHLAPKQIVHEAKRGKLKLTGLALGISRASYVWLAAAGVFFFR